MLRHVILFLLLCTFSFGFSQYYYDFNQNCKNAYSAIFSLKFEEGMDLINNEKSVNPDNNIPYLLENYIYFLTVFIGEEEQEFDKLEKLKDDIVDRLKDGNENSPYYRYCLAQVYLQWAFARTKFKEYVTATFEINKAYRLLEWNNEKHPDFLPNLINLGLLHTLIGTIPDKYNWIKKIVGIEGTIDEGTNEILKVLDASLKNDNYAIYRDECLFYLSFIQLNLSTNKKKAIDYIELIENNEEDKTHLSNPLVVYAIATIYMKNGMNNEALEILMSKPSSKEYYPFYYLDYLTGLAKLQRLDDDAYNYLLKYIMNFKGINYIKAAYQKIAWYYLVNGNTSKYKEYIEKAEKYGKEIVDADKQAEREASEGDMPNSTLLKARLLFDGGYYERALKELTKSKRNFLKTAKDTLENTYRIGRIYHEWGKTSEAIPYYKKTVENGAESEYYYAANSALNLGLIYEDAGNYEKAKDYYKRATSMKNKEYKNSIDQKAKAGLNRIENK